MGIWKVHLTIFRWMIPGLTKVLGTIVHPLAKRIPIQNTPARDTILVMYRTLHCSTRYPQQPDGSWCVCVVHTNDLGAKCRYRTAFLGNEELNHNNEEYNDGDYATVDLLLRDIGCRLRDNG